MDKELEHSSAIVGEMLQLTSPVQDKWKKIGLELGLPPFKLDIIGSRASDNCIRLVLDEWLQGRYKGPTWSTLIQALQSVGADETILSACRFKAMTLDQKSAKSKPTESLAGKKEENAKPELRDLVKLEVAPEWYDLGLELGLTPSTLDIIEEDVGHKVSVCRRKMFSKWLSSKTDASYTSLVDALIAIDKKVVAENVSLKFLGKSIYTTAIDPSTQSRNNYSLPKNSKLLLYLVSRYCITSKDKAEWPNTVQMEYINLSLITSTKKFHTLLTVKSKVEFAKQGKVQHILEQTKSIPLVDLLNYDANKKVVLIEGPPGVGKSTLANKLCTKWAKEEMLTEYFLVMCFPLREPLVRVAESIEELLAYFEDNCSDQDMEYIKSSQGNKVLLILDGWDELRMSCRGEDMFFPKLVKGDILPNCSIVITSRPGSTDFITNKAPDPRLIEVLGFTQEQIQDYIKAYFKKEGTPEAGESLLKDLAIYPNVANACYIAINLTIVCYVYCAGNYKLPPTLTEVYEAFVVHAVIRYLKKFEVVSQNPTPKLKKIDGLQDLNDPIKVMLKNLGQLALEGISKDELCFPQERLFTLCKPDESFIPFDGYGLLKILHISLTFRTDTFYHFLHLTIQEWLAAHHLSQLTNSDIATWLGKNLKDPRYEVVVQFFCGINQFQSPTLCSLVPKMKIDLSVCRWIFEGKWKVGCEQVTAQIGDTFLVGGSFARLTMQPYDSMVLLFMLKHSNTLWKLAFANVQLTNQVLANMYEEFISSPRLLRSLKIEQTNIQPDTAAMIGKIVQSQQKLTSFTLTQTDLDDVTLSAFCDTLTEHETLEDLNVSKNNFTAASALSLSSLLPKLVALKRFDVTHNNIGVKGYSCIIHAVNKMDSCSLEVLQLPIPHMDASELPTLANKNIQLKNTMDYK